MPTDFTELATVYACRAGYEPSCVSQTGNHCGDCLKDKPGRKHIWPKHTYLEKCRAPRGGMEIRREGRRLIRNRDEQPHFKTQS